MNIPNMQLLTIGWLPGCYTYHQTRTNSFWRKMLSKCTLEYEIDNRSVYDIMVQICKDTDLYPYVKQHKSKRDGRGATMPSIPGGWAQIVSNRQHQKPRWLCIHLHTMARRRHGTRKVILPDKFHIIVCKHMEYGYQGLDPGLKVWYVLNVIRCDKLSTAVATVMAHPEKYQKDFDIVVTFHPVHWHESTNT